MSEIRLQYTEVEAGNIDKVMSSILVGIESAKTMKRKVQYAAINVMIMAAWEGTCDSDNPDYADYKGKEWAEVACMLANKLVNETGSGVHGAALVKYFVYQCGFKVSEADKKAGFVDVAQPDWIRNHLEAAKAKPWFDYKAPNAFKGFDLMEELGRVLSRADKMAVTEKEDKEKAKDIHVDKGMLETLHALISGKPVEHKAALRLVERITPQLDEEETDGEDETSEPQQVAAVA